ncbi:hypothetical protein [Maricaulis sp.]|uniref:hypothetical protein n=1 Tax=Maricaulis sp. TaxID=1486257 RepID=UPI00262E1925|nr:hypothetical protein [Maricaulis sp.]
MSRIFLTVLISLSACLGACSSLQVRVDIANPDEVRVLADAGEDWRRMHIYRRQTQADLEARVASLRERYEVEFASVARALETVAANTQDQNIKDWVQTQSDGLSRFLAPDSDINRAFATYISRAMTLNEALNTALGSASEADRYWIRGPVAQALGARIAYDQTFIREQDSQIEFVGEYAQGVIDRHRRLVGAPAPAPAESGASQAVANAQARLKAHLRSIIGNGSLVDSDYAWHLANLPEEYWSEEFNEARAATFFGNGDIVLRLNSQGDFSVKGMSFNPASTAAMASKAATQILLTMAQASGVPVTSGTAGEPGAALANAGASLEQGQDTLMQRDAREQAWRAAIHDMASVILVEEGRLSDTDATRTAADATIESAFGAYRSLLDMSDYQ